MANKPLQSIKFPGLPDTYIVPDIDTTLTQTGQAADSKVVGDAIAESKNELKNNFPIKPYNTTFFDGANYFDPLFADYNDGGLAINASGEIFTASANAKTLVIPVAPNTQYSVFIPDGNRQYIGEKATNDFASGQTIEMLVTANADYPCTITTGATANYIFVYFNSGSYDYDTKKNQIKMCKGATVNNGYPTLDNNYLGMIPESKLDIFKGTNLFTDADTIYRTDRNINPTTGVIFTSSVAKSITFPVEPNTRYSIFVPDGNRSVVAEGTDSSFAIGSTKTVLVSNATLAYPIEFTTGAMAKYVFIVINIEEYDYENKKSGIKLFKGKYWNRPMSYLPMANMDEEINNLYGLNVLIFGDSITDCCNFTINADNETTAYTWKNPSNSYIDTGGNPIAYSMWPKILKDTQPLGEIRNYALSGASVKSEQRTAGNERLNLQYQIDLAINDLDNPNNAFTVDHFVPDIVIFAIGTNDVTPNDTYDSAMNVVTYLSDGVSVNVDATMAQLDPTKFCQSARLAFLKIKKLFPMAQIYYYLPLQRARYQQNTTTLHTELEKMAKRYGCIIIDGTFESGIIAEFEQVNHLGALLKDGLHPNEKGQNLMARQVLASIRSHFMPFEFGFNK